jgi:monoamine oxidase
MRTEVVVIGAGLAGLTGARALAQAGREVEVLEARGRVGGRIWSETLANGVTVERGGEFILDNYRAVPELAEELGLEFQTHGFPFADREPSDPSFPPRTELTTALGILEEHLRDLREQRADVSLAHAVDTAPIDPDARRVIRSRLTGTLADDLANVGAAWVRPASGVSTATGFTDSRRIKLGNQQIAQRMETELTGRIHLRQPAQRISHDRSSVRVTTTTGLEVHADAAIVAVPAPHAARLAVIPGYPELKARALAQLGLGIASKLHLPLAAPVTPRAIQMVDAPFWVYMASDAPDGTASAVGSFAGSPAVQTALEVPTGGQAWIRRVADLGIEFGDDHRPMLTSWEADPWAQHAYTYHPVGWTETLTGALCEPHGRLTFAGDYATLDQDAGMESAIRSGRRAAGEVLDLLS